ncbi:MAG: glycosyltransferase [Acidimicrobiia bacterium]
MTVPADVVLDCRWLGLWGAGRVTELLLRGLAESPPAGTWTLWGGRDVGRYAWPGAQVHVDGRDPRQARGQGAWFGMPPGRLTVFLQQQRPLRRVPAVTVILDTIQLRWSPGPVERRLRTAYLRRVAAVSGAVITISEHSRACIVRDLGVRPEVVTVVVPPLDRERADRLLELRRRGGGAGSGPAGGPPYLLYVGRFAPHKNLDRLVEAFAATGFRRGGGRLVLAGGSPAEAVGLRSALPSPAHEWVEVRTKAADGELDALMAGALALVQPSLEEGFGLPVAEALGGGVPVCVSDGGALPEVVAGVDGVLPVFPATSVPAMAAALDRCAAVAADGGLAYGERLAASARARLPTIGEFAGRFAGVVEGTLAGVGQR